MSVICPRYYSDMIKIGQRYAQNGKGRAMGRGQTDRHIDRRTSPLIYLTDLGAVAEKRKNLLRKYSWFLEDPGKARGCSKHTIL